MAQEEQQDMMDRRRFLRLGGLSVLGGVLLCGHSAAVAAVTGTDTGRVRVPSATASAQRYLGLHNIHTGENLSCVYWRQGDYDPTAITQVDRLLRDHRTGEIRSIDPALLDQLDAIAQRLQVAPEFHVISGFRSDRTNEALRSRSGNVARRSYHLLGQAVDIRMPNVPIGRLHQTALALRRGGVGLYRQRDFIHIDTGPVRTW